MGHKILLSGCFMLNHQMAGLLLVLPNTQGFAFDVERDGLEVRRLRATSQRNPKKEQRYSFLNCEIAGVILGTKYVVLTLLAIFVDLPNFS